MTFRIIAFTWLWHKMFSVGHPAKGYIVSIVLYVFHLVHAVCLLYTLIFILWDLLFTMGLLIQNFTTVSESFFLHLSSTGVFTCRASVHLVRCVFFLSFFLFLPLLSNCFPELTRKAGQIEERRLTSSVAFTTPSDTFEKSSVLQNGKSNGPFSVKRVNPGLDQVSIFADEKRTKNLFKRF